MRIIAVTTTALGTITFLSVAWPYLLPIIQNRNLWAAISLIAILLFTSGHMFNHIRKVPYVAGDGHGGISYFAGGFSNQYGLETQIVAAMCKIHPMIHLSSISMPQTEKLSNGNRWSSVIRDYLFGLEGATYG
jgi:oligosaccharyltransferase complex subunit gamma